jgi:hypothetical protein
VAQGLLVTPPTGLNAALVEVACSWWAYSARRACTASGKVHRTRPSLGHLLVKSVWNEPPHCATSVPWVSRYAMRQFRGLRVGSAAVQQFALEDRVEVMRGEAHPLRSISVTDASCREELSVVREPCDGGAFARMPTPRATWLVEPHSVESDLSRSCHSRRHRLFGSDAVRQLPAPYVPTFVEVCGESDLREPSPHSVMRFRHHSSMDRTRSVVSCEARLRVPRVRKVVGVIPPSCAPRTRSLRPLSARGTSRHFDDPSCVWTGTRRVDVT